MSIFTSLLHDRDDDGVLDSLKGVLFLPAQTDIDTLRAASEFLARLSTRTVCLQPDFALWKPVRYGFFIGTKPPDVPKTIKGFQILFSQEGLGFLANSSKTLLKGTKWFSGWPYLLEGLNLENFCEKHTLKQITWHKQTLKLEFSQKLKSDALDTSTISAIRIADGALVATLKDLSVPHTNKADQCSFSLGNAFHGGGLYSGSPAHPEQFMGTLHIDYPIKEAIKVASRLSTEGLCTRLPVTSAKRGLVHLGLDPKLRRTKPEIRITRQGKYNRLEIVGNTESDLSRAACFFADRFPLLPEGETIHELETSLSDLLQNHTRMGRLASLAVTKPPNASQAFQSNPPYQSPQLLKAPVRNSMRDGQQQRWRARFPWEGRRFLEVVEGAKLGSHQRVQIRAFLSESLAMRQTLTQQIKNILETRGIKADVEILSAYKPGFYWLLEQVASQARALNATRLEVTCATHKQGIEVKDRWLRELYPIAEALEQHHGLEVSLLIDNKQHYPYIARAFNAQNKVLLEESLDPPVHKIPVIGCEKLYAFPTTGQVTISNTKTVLLEQHIPTDRDLVWAYYTTQVLPELSQYLHSASQPLFSDLSIRLDISEADDYSGVDHEYCSAVEAMHEEFYFGSLEVFSALLGQSFSKRLSTPGWILPFCKATPGQDTQIQVLLNLPGTQRLGWENSKGRFRPVKETSITVSAQTLQLTSRQPRLALNVLAPTRKAASQAAAKVQWLLEQRNSGRLEWTLSQGTDLELTFRTSKAVVKKVIVKAHNMLELKVPNLKRDTPLHPREVVTLARDFSKRFAEVHLKPLKETRLGQPLVCLELGVRPGASRTRLAHWKPTVLISARQHANEPTSTNANFLWLQDFRSNPLLKKCNIIFHPLENPDGARLYTALHQLAIHHMHHAARYTSLGSDIETTPHLSPERQLHGEAQERWFPIIHLNNHGYPAHEWTRPHSGYVPAYFEDWSLPFGYLAILLAEPEAASLLKDSQKRIAKRLTEAGLVSYTQAQIKRNLRYQSKSVLPFTFEEGLPFLLRVRNKEEKIPAFQTKTRLTLISEVPDESVTGALWQSCVLAHQVMNQAMLEVLIKHLQATTSEVLRLQNSTTFP